MKSGSDKNPQPKRMGRPPKDPTTPPGARSKTVVSIRMPPAMVERFDNFIEAYNQTHPRTDKAAHAEKALAEYLDREEAKLPKSK